MKPIYYLKLTLLSLVSLLLLQSCVSKKQMLYLQDIDSNPAYEVVANKTTLQVNDILKIDVGALMVKPEVLLLVI